MNRNLVIVLFFIPLIAFTQELSFALGKNFTKYKYFNSKNEPLAALESGSGLFVDVGLTYNLDDSEIVSYTGSLNYNQYNAKAFINRRTYSWETHYLGIKNLLSARLLKTRTSFSTKVFIGIGLSHILAGKQNNNGISYDIKDNPEFKGLFFQPIGGCQFTYEINSDVYVSCGYNYSYSMNLNTSIEKIDFSNNQLVISFHFMPK